MILEGLMFALLLMPGATFAQINPTLIPEGGQIGNCNFITGDIHFDCIPLYIAYLVRTVFGLIGSIALIEIIISGYQMAISGFSGDKTAAKNRLTWSLIGLALSVFAWLIVDTILTVFISG
jgi:hypothetical protein